ncbi:PAS domain-containing protein [Brevundimonas sp. 2YAF1]
MPDNQDFLFRCSPDPMWIYDRETLAFKVVNEAATRRYGFSEAEFLAMTIEDIRPQEDQARLLAAVAGSPAGPEISGPWRHRARNGEIMTVEVRSFGMIYMGRPSKIVAVRDITELARLEIAEEEARRAQKAALDLLAMAGRVARFGGWRLELPSRVLTWSDETAAIHGETPGTQVTPERCLAYYLPEHRETVEAMLERCLSDGEPFDEVLQIVTADQRRRWVRATGEAERDANLQVTGLRGGFQDIDELVRTRLKSEAVERQLTETLNASREGFVVLDEHWRFVFVNKAAGRMLGRSPRSLQGRNMWEEFPQALGGPFEAKYRGAVAGRHSVAFEEFYPDLGWFDIRAYPSAGGLAVHFQNITERKRIQADLEASEERFRLIASVTNDVFWDLDLAAGRMWWNEPMAHQFGHPVEAAADRPDFWLRNVHPEDRSRVRETVEAAVSDGADGWSSAYRIIKGDGAIAHVIDRAAIVRGPDGCAQRMLGSMTDVSERLEMETRLLESQKIEALGRLTGGIAHDFNNLLTVIMGNSETLMESAIDSESRELAQLNVTAAAKGADLIGRLLAFSRRQPLTPRPVDVRELLVGLEPLLRRTINADILLAIESAPDLPPVLADVSQLESALLNLVVNARDAMPKGGQVTVRARVADARASEGRRGPAFDVAAKAWLEISVSDTGEGMTPDVQRQAFDPFFTTKAVGKGTGLGLSTVYGFAAQSEGSVHIASHPGAGTTVRMLLPCTEEAATSPAETRPEPTSPPRTGERILVVEDDPLVRDHVVRQLRAVGYCIVLAADGPEALACLQEEPGFDLMFTDVVMPGGMDGQELARQARAIAPDLRVLFTSGFIGPLDAASRIPAGQWLCKPYRRQELITRVREILLGP